MLLIRSLAALALLSISGAVPVPKPVADDASNTYSYDVVNVDGSNAQATSSVAYGDNSNDSSTVGVAEPTSTGVIATTTTEVNVVTGTSIVEEPTTTYTIEYTSTTTTTVQGKKRTVWITETAGQNNGATSTTEQSSPLTTEASTITETPSTTETSLSTEASPTTEVTTSSSVGETDSGSSLQYTVMDGTTYLVSVFASTLKAATTMTYESLYTSTIVSGGMSSVVVQTIAIESTSSVAQTSSTAAQTSSTAVPTAETRLSLADPSTSSPATISPSTTPSSSATTSTSTKPSSTITPSSSTKPSSTITPSSLISPSSSAISSSSSTLQSSSITPSSSTSQPSSTITAAPSSSSALASASETAFATITSDGVCEVYYEDIYDEDSTYYVSGSDASIATTTITSTVITTVSLS